MTYNVFGGTLNLAQSISLSTSGPVITEVGDRIRVQFPVRDIYLGYVASHPGQLSLAIPSWVGTMSTSQRAVMSCGW